MESNTKEVSNNILWDPKEFPKNVPADIKQKMYNDEQNLYQVFKQHTSVFDSMPFCGMKDDIKTFSDEFCESVADDFACATLLNVEFFASLMYHGWLIIADGLKLADCPYSTFPNTNYFGLCTRLHNENTKPKTTKKITKATSTTTTVVSQTTATTPKNIIYRSLKHDFKLIPLVMPKLHVERVLIPLQPIGVTTHKSDIKKARDYYITFNTAFHVTMQNCVLQHGGRWLIPELRECYAEMYHTNDSRTTSKLASVEIWMKIEDRKREEKQGEEKEKEKVDVENEVGATTSTTSTTSTASIADESTVDIANTSVEHTATEPAPLSFKERLFLADPPHPFDVDRDTRVKTLESVLPAASIARLTPSSNESEYNRIMDMYKKGYVLVGGEIGSVVGSIYTSLTAWRDQRPSLKSVGTIQLITLGHTLSLLGFKVWDLGQTLEYKSSIGGVAVPRSVFRDVLNRYRDDVDIPLSMHIPINAKEVIQKNLQLHRKYNTIYTAPSTDSELGCVNSDDDADALDIIGRDSIDDAQKKKEETSTKSPESESERVENDETKTAINKNSKDAGDADADTDEDANTENVSNDSLNVFKMDMKEYYYNIAFPTIKAPISVKEKKISKSQQKFLLKQQAKKEHKFKKQKMNQDTTTESEANISGTTVGVSGEQDNITAVSTITANATKTMTEKPDFDTFLNIYTKTQQEYRDILLKESLELGKKQMDTERKLEDELLTC